MYIFIALMSLIMVTLIRGGIDSSNRKFWIIVISAFLIRIFAFLQAVL